MKVSELIELLKTSSQDNIVIADDSEWGEFPVVRVQDEHDVMCSYFELGVLKEVKLEAVTRIVSGSWRTEL